MGTVQTDDERIDAIRQRVHAERALAYALSQQLTGLRDLLKPCNNLLDDVSFFFLDEVTLNEMKSTEAMKRWLDKAEYALKRAIEQREFIDHLVRQYGTNAQIVRSR
jgi:hypothetical protein